jgi:hypothetical protein
LGGSGVVGYRGANRFEWWYFCGYWVVIGSAGGRFVDIKIFVNFFFFIFLEESYSTKFGGTGGGSGLLRVVSLDSLEQGGSNGTDFVAIGWLLAVFGAGNMLLLLLLLLLLFLFCLKVANSANTATATF